MKISVCMIVKNEEAFLDKSLKSIVNHVNEVVIVDTGSTDKTKEVAGKYTSKIFDFNWYNDFSKARNFSVSKATNDWILVLDADEVVTEFNDKDIQRFMNNYERKPAVGSIKLINFLDSKIYKSKSIEKTSRIFNKKYFHFRGRIHEQIVRKDGENQIIKPINMTIEHYGYTKEVLKNKNKIERNLTYLKKSISDNASDSYLHYQLGKTYFIAQDYENSIKAFSKALSIIDNFKYEYIEDLVECYGYSLVNSNKFAEAMILERYEKYYFTKPDYNFIMGLIYMNNAKFRLAIESFSKCIDANDGKIEGIDSYLPNYNIGVIFECMGFLEQALEYYKKCGNYKLALDRIVLLERAN